MRRPPFPCVTLRSVFGASDHRIKESDMRSFQASFLKFAIQLGHLPHVLLPSEMPAPHLGPDDCAIGFRALLNRRRVNC
ncbi:hypothetical protein BTJ68_09074 [Hortaea werneckii EXF-2000]|uniref:Uncharacterized protein n=2 Tax=Hortaea werneckii TaxID=91943 RepID=A0A3M7H7H7_HORWE|nr:hypothetical protein BTJ68_09074 [Hortaea werneckii EXF-2000]RMZ08842.1 hypothetical protein D0860_04506 [Hortaea werneckii]RMZ26886.1 hypothetical protein D0859_09056 [Hortaea werneckii]